MNASDYVTIRLGAQDFGVPVADVRDVLRRQKITPVPLAPRAVAGLLNLRGRIVTAVDLRLRLGLPNAAPAEGVIVVVERDGELYALAADAVGDVLHIAQDQVEPVPAALDPQWRQVAAAVYPAERGFVVLFDIGRLLDIAPKLRAAS